MVEKNLERNLDFIESKKGELLKYYKNKFLLVYEGELIGTYDDYASAAAEGIRTYGISADFLVHHLVDKEPVNFIMEAVL